MATRKQTAKTTAKQAAPAAAPAPAAPEKKLSLLNAAVTVLERSEEALNTKTLVERAKVCGLWVPGNGKTPEQTLYSAMVREIKEKGPSARFTKEGGLFRFKR